MTWIDDLQSAGDHATKVKGDLPYFSQYLKIRPKVGSLAPFTLNAAQLELHRIIEEQRAKTGRVRVVVLKARQLGVSTYVASRFYHRTVSHPGLRTIIVAHKVDASRNLFQIVKRFHDHLPDDLRPSIAVSNAEELIFDRLDSGYLVTVATTEGAGRSATAQLLHASETAFWPDLQTQWAALLQTIPDADGTEIILETTANSYNDFFKLWRKAEAGESEFMPVFLPWSVAPEYRAKVGDDFEMTGAEKRLAELYDLDIEQIAWRRNKISQLGSEEYFQQEYPLNASEAFISAQFDSFIPADPRAPRTQRRDRALRRSDSWRGSRRDRYRLHGDRLAPRALHHEDRKAAPRHNANVRLAWQNHPRGQAGKNQHRRGRAWHWHFRSTARARAFAHPNQCCELCGQADRAAAIGRDWKGRRRSS
jgi:hypothetical protein